MTNRRTLLTFATLGTSVAIALPSALRAADSCPPSRTSSVNAAILDRYVAAINSLDVSAFPGIFADGYIQHSGRSPSGLSAQIENAQRLHAAWPDLHMQVEDRIIDANKVVARCLYAATHTQTVRGFAPTGRKITFVTIDIWRVEGEKFAEHWDLVDLAGMEKQLAGK
ncbi:putative ester cyclase [Bradyrhizobium sp. AZCC 2230]